MKLNVVLEKTDKNWCAFSPDDIGVVFSTGDTRDEVISNFRVALDAHLQAMREDSLNPPDVTELAISETLPVGAPIAA